LRSLPQARKASPVIGIGGSLAAPPSHTTLRTGPYRAVLQENRVNQLMSGDQAI